MIRFVIAFLSIFVGLTAVADTVPILSGEHETYTRLVLTIDPETPWTLDEKTDERQLVLSGSHELQIKNIFDRIPKTRLLDVSTISADGSTILKLDLNCSCDVNVYPYQGAYLILDISDPSEDNETSVTQSSLPAPSGFFSPDSLPTLEMTARSESLELPVYGAPDTDFLGHGVQLGPNLTVENNTEEAVVAEVDPELQKTVDEARDALIRQLSFAADQGLLDFKPNNSLIVEEPFAQEIMAEVVEEPAKSPMDFLMDQEQVSIQSIYELDSRNDPAAINSGKQCFQAFDFDVQNWGSGEDFSSELSNLRTQQLGEFDTADVATIESLIKLYIRYGFDVEARYLIASYRDEIRFSDILYDLSFVMTGNQINPKNILAIAADCNGAAGLWALTSEATTSNGGLLNQEAALRVFEHLPADIRRTIGPRLIEAYLRRGMQAEAQLAADLISRAFGQDGPAVELSQADLLIQTGQTPAAEGVYQNVIAANKIESVPALIELVELFLAENRPIPAEYVDRIKFEAVTQRGTVQGLALRSLDTRLEARNSGEKYALAGLRHEMEVDPAYMEHYQEIGRNVLLGLSHNNPEFLNIVMSNVVFLGESGKNPELRTYLANEALAFGFPNAASWLLSGAEPTDTNGLVLAGSIGAATGDNDKAALALHLVDEDSAKLQLVKVYIADGKFEEALAAIDSIQTPEMQSVNPGWFSGSWRDAAASDPAALTIYRLYLNISDEVPAKTVVTEPQPANGSVPDSLEQVRSTLTDVAELQDEISALGLSEN